MQMSKSKAWDFFNKPLIAAAIIAALIISYNFFYGQDEKVRCDYIVGVDKTALKTELNLTDDEVNSFLNLYSEPLFTNWTFDSYQEALAFKELLIESIEVKTINEPQWYEITLYCDVAKISIDKKLRDSIEEVANR